MEDEEGLLWARIEQAVGEEHAVGEVECCRLLWAAETARAMEEGERSTRMQTLRRRVRSLVKALRLDYNLPVLDSALGYYLAASKDETLRFCESRHRRGLTSLVIESIVRRENTVKVGVQRLFAFLRSEEKRRQRVAERTGSTFAPMTTQDVIAEIMEQDKATTD